MSRNGAMILAVGALVILLTCSGAPAGWVAIEDFNALTAGSTINGQATWVVHPDQHPERSTVEARPGGVAGDQVLRTVDATRVRDGVDLGIAQGSQATFFFQAYVEQVSGDNHFRLTLANEAAPTSYTNSDVFFRIDGRTDQNDSSLWRNRLYVGPSDGNQQVTNYRLDADQWYNVWLDVDNAAKTYQAYVAPAGSAARVQLAVGGNTTFNFDNTFTDSLKTFWMWTDSTANGRAMLVDNIQVDTAGYNATQPTAVQLPLVTQTASHPGGQTWTNGTYWSDGQPAGAGKSYLVPAGITMRTPDNVSNPSFPGDVLTVKGMLALKHNGTATFPNLVLDGGTVGCWVGNRTMAVEGNILVAGNSVFEMSGDNWRTTELQGVVTGGGNITLRGDGSSTRFIVNADTSMHTGGWIVENLTELWVNNGVVNVPGNLSVSYLRVGRDGRQRQADGRRDGGHRRQRQRPEYRAAAGRRRGHGRGGRLFGLAVGDDRCQ